ncbi:MAG: alanine racemase [Candidatus Muiribacterium halophilum]|uniref:Alanine racemase n=1 Tax=Muiribacterium halophilum TaxID=2053465 RepID=A0A2N5Z9N5_MUIH1|nr:MAG: alanine racemase [Candidatus Muirbacterium halophilum]
MNDKIKTNPTRAYIYLDNLRYNLENIRKKTNTKILAAVKANAYGHGAIEVSRFIEENKLAEYLGIATTNEAIELREADLSLPILKFSHSTFEEIPYLIKNNIECAVYSTSFLKKAQEEAKKQNKTFYFHLKIDTGMGRVGVLPHELQEFLNIYKNSTNTKLKGVMTHFPVSDERNKSFTKEQIKKFRECVETIKENNIDPGILHTANSGAIIDLPETYFDMVRPGIMMYGYYPSSETTQSVTIKPVMTLVSKILHIKKVKSNTPISYGSTYHTFDNSYIATIPVGYGDGYDRSLSNRGKVCCKGLEYKIAGRVCMDQFMIDLGNNPAKITIEDDVVLFGTYKGSHISLYYLCSLLNTITYEPLCNVAPRIPRIYL